MIRILNAVKADSRMWDGLVSIITGSVDGYHIKPILRNRWAGFGVPVEQIRITIRIKDKKVQLEKL